MFPFKEQSSLSSQKQFNCCAPTNSPRHLHQRDSERIRAKLNAEETLFITVESLLGSESGQYEYNIFQPFDTKASREASSVQPGHSHKEQIGLQMALIETMQNE